MDTNKNGELANNSNEPQLTDELISIIEKSKAIYFKVKNASDDTQYVNLFKDSEFNRKHVLIYIVGCDTAQQFSYEELMAYLQAGKTKTFDRVNLQSNVLINSVPIYVEFSSLVDNENRVVLKEISYDPYQQQNCMISCDLSHLEGKEKASMLIDKNFKMSFKMKPDTQLVVSFYEVLPPYMRPNIN